MKILLATDGSESARVAVDFLTRFPLPATAQITLVTVVREMLSSDETEHLADDRRQALDTLQQQQTTEARQLLDEETGRLQQAGFAVDSRVLSGRPAEEIVRQATESESDLVVVGSHGLGGVKRFLLGGVSDRVFEYAPCSVLVVRPPTAADAGSYPGPGQRPWRLLLAYDDSPPAREALELCAQLPLEERATIRAVTVLPLIHAYRQDIRMQLSWVWQEKKRAAEMALEWLAGQLKWKDIELSTELIESDNIAQAVLDAATESASDLVVVGHKSHSAFERFLLGAVAARIAHHAPCSVLSVRARD